jgi:hypothetical protein
MPEMAELTRPERAMFATAASAAYLDRFSCADRQLVSEHQQPNLIDRERRYYSRGQQWSIKWQDRGQPLPGWFDSLMQGFVDLLTLPENWNSYGAGQIDSGLVREAMNQMNGLLGPENLAPHVVPLSTGGLQLEWHRNSVDLEIVYDKDEAPFYEYRNRTTGERLEGPFDPGDAVVRGFISALD